MKLNTDLLLVCVCLSVCLSESVSQKTVFRLHQIFATVLHVAEAGFLLPALRYVMYFRFVEDVMLRKMAGHRQCVEERMWQHGRRSLMSTIALSTKHAFDDKRRGRETMAPRSL